MESIIAFLDSLSGKFGISIDWGKSDFAEYLKELGPKIINYEITTSYIWIVISALIMIIGIMLIVLERKGKVDWEGFMTGIGIFLVVVSFVIICTQVYDIATCYAFPDRVILEHIRNTIHTMTGSSS